MFYVLSISFYYIHWILTEKHAHITPCVIAENCSFNTDNKILAKTKALFSAEISCHLMYVCMQKCSWGLVFSSYSRIYGKWYCSLEQFLSKLGLVLIQVQGTPFECSEIIMKRHVMHGYDVVAGETCWQSTVISLPGLHTFDAWYHQLSQDEGEESEDVGKTHAQWGHLKAESWEQILLKTTWFKYHWRTPPL